MSLVKLQDVSERIAKAREELNELAKDGGKEAVGELFMPLLKKYESEIERISWRQYTPYFNDGDACVFRVHGLCIIPVNRPEDEQDYEDYEYEIWGKYREDSHSYSKEAFTELTEAFDGLGEDILESIFGDHMKITVTKDGVTVEEYSHD